MFNEIVLKDDNNVFGVDLLVKLSAKGSALREIKLLFLNVFIRFCV